MSRLQEVDWSDEIQRRIALATLVQGANLLARKFLGTYKEREKPESRCIKLGFELLHDIPLVDKDGTPYGAIFKNNCPYHSKSGFNPPKYIFAFRGTILTPIPVIKDLTQDSKFIAHRLHKSSRVKHALDKVLIIISTLAEERPDNVWLAGHSLGSAIALAVGTKLVLERGILLETLLFNPPTVSSIFGVSDIISRSINSFIIAPYINSHQSTPSQEVSERFDKLSRSTWTPNLFINIYDPICNGHVSYFEDRETMRSIGFERIGMIATQLSFISLIGEAVGRDWQAIHLIPSANLTITLPSDFNIWSAHMIKQRLVDKNPWYAHKIKRWLEPSRQCRSKLYRFDDRSNKTICETSASNMEMSQEMMEQLQREKEVEVTRRQALEEQVMRQEAEMTAMKEAKVQQDHAIEELRIKLLSLQEQQTPRI